ncbi:SDR family oxidoreductase, partial [Desulfovibrio sp. OttesenSCG-928-I05]|nr:SDR family oxidoreductase [Desulfovibrio sp. OttesenSCG-928-I05]
MQIEFQGKNVLVVGAAQGIGSGIATAFAEAGAAVYACDLLADEVKKLEGPCGKGRISTGFVDVTKEDSVIETVAVAGKDGLDVLVYVAGGVAGQVDQPIEDVTLDQWRIVMDINLTGFYLFVREAVRIMKKAKKGRIISISSRAGLATSLTGIQSYCAAKHAQIGLVKQFGQELAPFNITVNSIAPGFLLTNPASCAQWESYTPEFRASFTSRLVGGRTGVPSDISNAALFLASEQAEWISGQVLPVMGGPV